MFSVWPQHGVWEAESYMCRVTLDLYLNVDIFCIMDFYINFYFSNSALKYYLIAEFSGAPLNFTLKQVLHSPALPDHRPFLSSFLLHLLPCLFLSHCFGMFPTHPLNVSVSKNSVFSPCVFLIIAWITGILLHILSANQSAYWTTEWTTLLIYRCISSFYTWSCSQFPFCDLVIKQRK